MAGPGDAMAAGAGGHGRLRASHADRDQVIGTLQAAFVQGMLSKDEFDLRVGQTLASRTWAELTAVTADLPAGLAAAKPSPPARAQGGPPAVRPGRVLAVTTAGYASVSACELLLGFHRNAYAMGQLLAVGFIVYLGVLLVCVGAIIANWQDKRSGGQPPRRPSVGGCGG
jgi:Domain of unknown function (DUF1707)